MEDSKNNQKRKIHGAKSSFSHGDSEKVNLNANLILKCISIEGQFNNPFERREE